jgi:hypothetical protein
MSGRSADGRSRSEETRSGQSDMIISAQAKNKLTHWVWFEREVANG